MDKKCFENADRVRLGTDGEALASRFLLGKGYLPVEKNYRRRGGQIDLIMEKENSLIFVEVKTRRVNYFGVEEDTLSDKQLKTLIKTALFYLRERKVPGGVTGRPRRKLQFDLVVIDLSEYQVSKKGKVKHYQDLLRYSG